jgi:hypothetical protein
MAKVGSHDLDKHVSVVDIDVLDISRQELEHLGK